MYAYLGYLSQYICKWTCFCMYTNTEKLLLESWFGLDFCSSVLQKANHSFKMVLQKISFLGHKFYLKYDNNAGLCLCITMN